MKPIVLTLVVQAVFAACCSAGELPHLTDQKGRDSYSIGYEYGSGLREQRLDLDNEVLLRAVRDALEERKPALTPAEMKDTLADLGKRTTLRQERLAREQAAATLEKEKEFLAANRQKPGVRVLPDGIQYRVLLEGTGAFPGKKDLVKVTYRGSLIDGTEFDSSSRREEPALIPVSGGLRGLDQVLPLMRVGSTWQIVVPSRLAYGARGTSEIPPNSTLIFDLDLHSIAKGGGQRSRSPQGE